MSEYLLMMIDEIHIVFLTTFNHIIYITLKTRIIKYRINWDK